MIDLSTLACEQVQVTLPEQGETLTRFAVRAGDVLMADRGLAHRRGIRHVVTHEGDVIVRMNLVSVPLEDAKGRAMALLPRLRKLTIGQARAWPALMRDEHGSIAVRVCALKKSAEQTRKSQEKVRQIAAKKARVLSPALNREPPAFLLRGGSPRMGESRRANQRGRGSGSVNYRGG